MKILRYKDLETHGFERKIAAVEAHLSKGDFRAADVKKMVSTEIYRAKLDKESRLLFSIARHNSEKVILLLELIRSHRYERSRFLNGKNIETSQLEDVSTVDSLDSHHEIKFVEKDRKNFHFLNKPIVFDQEQENLFHFPFPSIIVGSAGSGKTAISLEKMKTLSGDILYVTLSSFLAENSRDLYYARGYNNDKQNIDFLSFYELLESFAIPEGKEVSFRDFSSWLANQGIKDLDAHELFEEFKGVLTGVEISKPYLSQDDYLSLGIKQSIYPENKRALIYDLFQKYLLFLRKKDLFDLNILSHTYLDVVGKKYDYLLIDEIQDFTNIQVYLLLKTLKPEAKNHFLFCGDSNQIVHPNFFSWSHLKSLFFKEDITKNRIFNILQKNYRSSHKVTELSNKVLRIKNKRFGSIDKESNYLINPIGEVSGSVKLLASKDKALGKLNQQTSRSTQFAVIVLHEQDKAKARKVFNTPLLFSIREVKGLEYENIILFDFISGEREVFEEIVSGVTIDDLDGGQLSYSRAKDKSDKSLEIYKFFINSLYVAISRSTKNLFWIENNLTHPLVHLLGLKEQQGELDLKVKKSSQEEWQKEAQRLAMQGKEEQAEAIRSQVLQLKPLPWKPFAQDELKPLTTAAYQKANKQAQRKLLAYGVLYHDPIVFTELYSRGYKFSDSIQGRKDFTVSRFCKEWRNENDLMREIKNYGIDYKNKLGQTPLMGASLLGNIKLVEKLIEFGAKTELTDFAGRSAFDIATAEAIRNQEFMTTAYPSLFKLLAPSYVKIRFDNKLIKIDQRLMEYTLLNVLKVSLWILIQWGKPIGYKHSTSFNAPLLTDIFERFPNSVLPEKRKKRSYISSLLSKNEIFREDPYNRKIFLREQKGLYHVNPCLELYSNAKWSNFCSLMGAERFAQTNSSTDTIKERIKEFQKIKDLSLAEQ